MNVPENFNKQIALRKQYIWKKRKVDFDKDDIRDYIGTKHFKTGFDMAYEKKGKKFRDTGLHYEINPLTGEKEMFVAGSQGITDWIFNLTNAISYGTEKTIGKYLDKHWNQLHLPFSRPKFYHLNPDRRRQQIGISRMATKHGVDVMYGHSRAGALVADTPFSGRKYGLDSAMILAENVGMKNYRRDSYFDAVLGLSGKDNIKVSTGRSIHWAYGS